MRLSVMIRSRRVHAAVAALLLMMVAGGLAIGMLATRDERSKDRELTDAEVARIVRSRDPNQLRLIPRRKAVPLALVR